MLAIPGTAEILARSDRDFLAVARNVAGVEALNYLLAKIQNHRAYADCGTDYCRGYRDALRSIADQVIIVIGEIENGR